MALLPEPLEDLLAAAERIVVAEVSAVWDPASQSWGAAPPNPDSLDHATAGGISRPIGAAPPRPEQRVRLRISQTVRGVEAAEVEADKPAGAYLLVPGSRGPFLLGAGSPRPTILGRYGPDTYPLDEIEEAVGRGADNQ